MSIKQAGVAVTFTLGMIGLTSFSTFFPVPMQLALPTTDRPTKTVGGGTRYVAVPTWSVLTTTDQLRRKGGGTNHSAEQRSSRVAEV
jgi:hypothetical protein